MPRGSKPGERRGGRKKGTPNKVTKETREVFKRILDNLAPEIEAWLRETAHGIEIEKTLPDGSTCIGRFGADPGKAVDVLLKLAEFSVPKLNRTEHVGDGGGPVKATVDVHFHEPKAGE